MPSAKKTGIKFKDFDKLTGKLRHASIGIPAGKVLFSPLKNDTYKTNACSFPTATRRD